VVKEVTKQQGEKRKPLLKVIPAPDKDGTAYPAGIDPSKIKDPTVRTAYQSAIANNMKLAEESKNTWRCSAADKELRAKFKAWAVSAYRKDVEDQIGLIREASKLGFSDALKEYVKGIFVSLTNP